MSLTRGFAIEEDRKHNLMRIVLKKSGPELNWNELSGVFKIYATDIINWELDLRECARINSLAIGNIVALNTSVMAHGGTFRLLVRKDSDVAKMLNLTRINLIIPVMENVVA